jgi:pimeloyl-ACP methyl ester carboxylesterase
VNRRSVLEAAAFGGISAAVAATGPAAAAETKASGRPGAAPRPYFVEARDGTRLYVGDWGSGRPVVLLTGWTLNSDIWGSHIAALAAKGFRCIAPDRRGHGRSDVPVGGYDVDTLTDDVAAVMERLDLSDCVLVGYSMGSMEAVRYMARHGSARVSRLVLIAPVTPYLLKTEDNPDAVPRAMIEAQYAEIAKDFPKWIADNEPPFFTPDTGAETRSWIKTMMTSVPLPVALACRSAISTTDTRAALSRIDRPTLIVHGDKDASAPIPITGAKSAKLIPGAKLVVVEGAPHALILTHRERVLAELLKFLGA